MWHGYAVCLSQGNKMSAAMFNLHVEDHVVWEVRANKES